MIKVHPDDPGTAIVRRLRESYFGALAGTYGTHEQILAYVRGEQDAWGE